MVLNWKNYIFEGTRRIKVGTTLFFADMQKWCRKSKHEVFQPSRTAVLGCLRLQVGLPGSVSSGPSQAATFPCQQQDLILKFWQVFFFFFPRVLPTLTLYWRKKKLRRNYVSDAFSHLSMNSQFSVSGCQWKQDWCLQVDIRGRKHINIFFYSRMCSTVYVRLASIMKVQFGHQNFWPGDNILDIFGLFLALWCALRKIILLII